MLRVIRTLFVLSFVFGFTVTLFCFEPTPKYFPHSLESFWVYEDQDGNELIRRVVKGEEIDGKLYHTVSFAPKQKDETADSPSSLYNVSDTGSITRLAGDEVAASIKAQLTREMSMLTIDTQFGAVDITIEVEADYDLLLFLPAKLAVDTPWEVKKIAAEIKIGVDDSDEATVFSFTITETGQVLGTETIKTPAGTFEDCMKVEYRTQTEVSITPEPPPDTEMEPPGETVTTLWFAPDIGIVKYHQKSDYIFLSMIPANELELDIATLLPLPERTLELKEVDIK